jgi:hypothetical protein
MEQQANRRTNSAEFEPNLRNPTYLSRIERADERTRTADLLITSELLYLLSYVGL